MEVLVIGSGIAGMCTAIEAAKEGCHVLLVSPAPSEEAQSVMAAGGINAALNVCGENDSWMIHADDTMKGGCEIENREDVENFCEKAPVNIRWLETLGVVFSRDENLELSQRRLGGHSHSRTAFAGTCTGKQIVTALIQKCREYECEGRIERKLQLQFHSALIKDGLCYGALLYNEATESLEPMYADYTVIATGGQNKLFGKTTGSELCDGYAAARLFTQGVRLRNLEFIQYHPTTIETEFKRMLISEGARSEGGRLFYLDGDKRVYFMEEKYGKDGNLMPRDVLSREISHCPSQVYLDLVFLGEKTIRTKLEEVRWLCECYLGLDITKEPIPIVPAIHFFMGGIKVNSAHQTDIRHLYAVGECASKYHGANRLGGNSLLAAIHSGRTAAEAIAAEWEELGDHSPEFTDSIAELRERIAGLKESESRFPGMYVLRELASTMNSSLGIDRKEEEMEKGLRKVRFLKKTVGKMNFDPEVCMYDNFRIYFLIILAEAILLSALARKESRGAHYRSDYPETREEYRLCSVAAFRDGEIEISFQKDGE